MLGIESFANRVNLLVREVLNCIPLIYAGTVAAGQSILLTLSTLVNIL